MATPRLRVGDHAEASAKGVNPSDPSVWPTTHPCSPGGPTRRTTGDGPQGYPSKGTVIPYRGPGGVSRISLAMPPVIHPPDMLYP